MGHVFQGLFVSLSVTFPSFDPGREEGRGKRDVEGYLVPQVLALSSVVGGCCFPPDFQPQVKKEMFVFGLDGVCFDFMSAAFYCLCGLLLLGVSKLHLV